MIQAATRHHRQQARLTARTVESARALWRQVDVGDIDGSFPARRLFVLLATAQLLAASTAENYVTLALDEQNLDNAPEGAVNPRAFTGVAADGRNLESLLYEPVVAAKAAIGAGAALSRALGLGEASLIRITATQTTDAGRQAVGVGIAARPRVGYVRMLNPPSCSRCAVLAGKTFKWNTGFQRHPHCDCRHVPTTENAAGDLRTDPRAYFDSLSEADQNRYFTNAGAQAIRDGADIGQVVNARRGMSTASVFGQQAKVTTEGITRRGFAGRNLIEQGAATERVTAGTALRRTARGMQERAVTREVVKTPRLMPEQIYADAKNRADAIRLLKRFGYLI